MSTWKPKRFWTDVTVEPVDGGFAVMLDNRRLRTPSKAELILPTEPFAQLVAQEWQAQSEIIDPLSMPATRSANSAVDKVSLQKSEVADMLAAYGDADLLCYRATSPQELIVRQAEIWDPYLDWAEKALGARLVARQGVMHVPQDQTVLAGLSARVHEFSNFELAGFHDLVSLTGSLILGFAATLEFTTPDAIWQASRVDENWQEEQWGIDEIASALAEQKRRDFEHAVRVFHLSRAK